MKYLYEVTYKNGLRPERIAGAILAAVIGIVSAAALVAWWSN